MRKNGESNVGVWVGVISFVLIIIAIITVLIIVSQNDSTEVEETKPPIKLYLKAVNYLNESETVTANFRIEVNGTTVESGILSKDSITELEVPRKQLRLICWSDEYYLGRTIHTFKEEELRANASKAVCNMRKIGKIDVTHTGELKEGLSKIKLNITATGEYGTMKICTRWSAGIISVLPENSELICDNGNWMNWSKYNTTTEEFTLMPDNYFRCGECNYPYCDWTARCSSTNGAKCIEYSTKTPNRYAGLVDDCYYPGKSLKDESVIIEYNVKASSINPLDEIEFFIMDSDRRHDPFENRLIFMTEQDGKTIAANDTSYVINYWDIG